MITHVCFLGHTLDLDLRWPCEASGLSTRGRSLGLGSLEVGDGMSEPHFHDLLT